MTAALERFVPLGVALLGAVQLLTGVVMLADAGFFYAEVATFAPENGHFIRDIGTYNVAIGAGLLWSARVPSWRLPLLAVGLLQYVLHAINHLVDIDATTEAAHGPANFAAVAIGAAFVALLMYGEANRRRGGAAGGDP
jgi:hypothetical protein